MINEKVKHWTGDKGPGAGRPGTGTQTSQMPKLIRYSSQETLMIMRGYR